MADQKTDTTPAPAEVKKADAPAAAAPAKAEAAAPAPKAEAPKAAAPKAAAKAPAKAAKPAKARRAPARKAAKAPPAKAAKPAKPAKTVRRAPAVAAAARSTTKTIRTNVNEGTRIMNKQSNAVADRFQAVFGDVNERAKTAIERNTRFAEELTELGKGNVEALVASTKVAAKGVESLGQEVAEYSRKSFEDASAALKSFAEVKSPTDFFRLQGDFARAQFDSFVAESGRLSEALVKVAGEVAEPLTNRYSVTAERVKAAVAL
jgi:phasin family protein